MDYKRGENKVEIKKIKKSEKKFLNKKTFGPIMELLMHCERDNNINIHKDLQLCYHDNTISYKVGDKFFEEQLNGLPFIGEKNEVMVGIEIETENQEIILNQ
jgi:hypothetical protein